MSLKIRIHTKGITGSRMTQPGEDSGGMFGCMIEINGQMIEEVLSADPHFGENFTEVDVKFIPGSCDVITHDDQSWTALTGRPPFGSGQGTSVHTGMGRVAARTPGGVG